VDFRTGDVSAPSPKSMYSIAQVPIWQKLMIGPISDVGTISQVIKLLDNHRLRSSIKNNLRDPWLDQSKIVSESKIVKFWVFPWDYPTLTLKASEPPPGRSNRPTRCGSAAQRRTLPNSAASVHLWLAIAKCLEILRILSFLVIATTSTTYTTITILNTIASFLISIPLISKLFTPS
jgi:hypothetical protein